MLALEILDIKDFTSKLFVGNVFDILSFGGSLYHISHLYH